MMNKDELMLALRAYDAISRLNDYLMPITGYQGLSVKEFEDVFCITELLFRNCSFYDKDNDVAYALFMEILISEESSLEEKSERLFYGKE